MSEVSVISVVNSKYVLLGPLMWFIMFTGLRSSNEWEWCSTKHIRLKWWGEFFCISGRTIEILGKAAEIVHLKLKFAKIYSPSGHSRCRWVCYFIGNIALHHLLTNGSSAVNGCRQNESPTYKNITVIHMTPVHQLMSYSIPVQNTSP